MIMYCRVKKQPQGKERSRGIKTRAKDMPVTIQNNLLTRQNGLQNNWLLRAYIAEIVIKTDKVFRALLSTQKTATKCVITAAGQTITRRVTGVSC